MFTLNGSPTFAVISALVVAGSWLWGLAVSAAPPEDAVPISFALQKASVTLREPVFVELRIENRLTEQVTFDLGFNEKANFQFIVTEPAGSRVLAPALEERGFGATGHITLEPGGTFKRNVLVNEWYQFSKAGVYSVQVKLKDLALETASGSLVSNEVLSRAMLLQVNPADATTLSEVCERLLESARTSRGYAKRAEDAVALSYILDPVAVPFLAKLAKTPQLEMVGVLGLARIADREGIEQVISSLGAEDPELEKSIRNALQCVKQGCRMED